MAVYQGRGAAIGIGEESTYGTAVSRSNWRPVISCNLLRVPSVVPRTDLHSGGPTRRGRFIEREEAGGDVQVLATYDNIGMLLKAAMGGVSTSGSDPYTHVYTLASTLGSVSIEHIRGQATNSEVFEGCKVTSMGLECSSGTEMIMSLNFIAETAAARASAGTPSFSSTENVVLHHQAGQFTFNSVAYDISSFNLTLSTGMDRRDLLGSKLTKEPLRAGYADITLSVTLEAQDAFYTAVHAETSSDAVITWTSGTKSIAFTVQNSYIESASDPVSDAGVVSQDVVFKGISDGSDHGLNITVINGNSSGTAN